MRAVLKAVTRAAPKRFVVRSLCSAETTVQIEMIAKTMPEWESGGVPPPKPRKPGSARMAGQAAPSSPSGSPSPMKAR